MSFSPGSLATMCSERTTHTLVPSWRRVYTSRAIWIAIFESAACKLPQCLWSRPLLDLTNTSHSGHSFVVMFAPEFNSDSRKRVPAAKDAKDSQRARKKTEKFDS